MSSGPLRRVQGRRHWSLLSHQHGHEHEHDHQPPLPSTNSPLPRGAGIGKVLFVDAPSGIAGDMTVAALLDLGVPFEVIRSAVDALKLSNVRIALTPARAGSLGGSRFQVEISGDQPHRRYQSIDEALQTAPLDGGTAALARRIFRRLAEAESEVHRVPIETVEFHEVGSADSIVDIVGAAAGFAYLGARVVATPLPLNGGFVRCEHGRLPLPAPATLLCLRGVPTYDSGLRVELVTPTGAAILATIAESFAAWPTMIPERVGLGCGTRRLPDRPNALRLVLGQLSSDAHAKGSHVILEANIDDMTGELAAHAIEALRGSGALDAWAVPATMKKGRPGLVLSALAERSRAEEVAHAMLRETSSIGVRRIPVSRTERPRKVVPVPTAFGIIPVKVSDGPFGPPHAKPEFDVCVRAARAAGVPVREVLAAALVAFANLSAEADAGES